MDVVCDTNVLVSALLWKGELLPLYELINRREITLCFSKATLNELVRVSCYPHIADKAKEEKIELDKIIKTLASNSKVVFPQGFPAAVVKDDPSDDKFLACAVAAQVSFIISGDKHLLNLKEFRGVLIVSSREFLKITKPLFR